jgi:hypothetical protein
MSEQRTTYSRAVAGYDSQFEQALADAIIAAIAQTSMLTDAPAVALRVGETLHALTFVLEMIAACSPQMDDCDRLHSFAKATARRIERNVARLRATREFAAHVFGARRRGTA